METGWRREGKLVHCDPIKDGIWIFQSGSGWIEAESSIVEAHGIRLSAKDKGTYEPASLAQGKQIGGNSLSTPSSSSSPSSSLENAIRTNQALNARAVQANSSQKSIHEPPTPSPEVKLGTAVGETLPSAKDIHESFISAVLGSIVYLLCRDHGFVPLNSRTLILTSPNLSSPGALANKILQNPSEITLATLDISLTSLGTLVVKAHSDTAPGLQRLMTTSNQANLSEKLTPGTPLWLAPGGTSAKFHGTSDDKNQMGDEPISQLQSNPADHRLNAFNSVTINSWQSRCLEWLAGKGLNTAGLETGGWLFVQVLPGHPPYSSSDYQGIPLLDDLTVIPWPALLCFQTSNYGARDSQGSSVLTAGTRDPLSFAEQWFTGKDERASAILKRQKERQVAEALSEEQADVDARALQSTTYSPAALRRGSNAGAMYPTPPDAIHHPVGVTPSFDGTVSTPGNPNPFATNDAGAPTTSNPPLPDADTEMWNSSGKKERTSSATHFPSDNDNDNDNLFSGDISGGDIFGTDITDADFSFFDEPDNVLFGEKPGSPAVIADSAEQEPSNLGDTTFINNPKLTAPEQALDTEMQDQKQPEPVSHQHAAVEPLKAGVSESTKDEAIGNAEGVDIVTEKPPQPIISPPFNKATVFRRLFQEPKEATQHTPSRRASLFNKINFETSLLFVNEKYGAHGQFNFSVEKAPKRLGSSEPPKTEYLSSRRKPQDDKKAADSITRIFLEADVEPPAIVADPMDYLIGSDGASQMSEQDDTSHTTDEQSLPTKFGVKRKWQWDNDDESAIASPFDSLAMDFEHAASTPQSITGSQFPLLEADPADWSLTTYFTSPEPDVQSNALSDTERIATAQILADQAVSGTLILPGNTGMETPTHSNKASATRELMQGLKKAAAFCLKDITVCTMRSFIEIQGIPVLNQTLRLPPRPVANPRVPNVPEMARPNNPFPIPPPRLELRRSESTLSVLPSAVSFWENLGLGPSKGPKDINAVCVYPNFEGVAANASTLLDQMRSIYESSRLGGHERITSKDIANSLLPYAVDPVQQNKTHSLSALKETTGRLGRILASLPSEEKNFVVYFVYPVDNATLLVHICSAFQHLFNLYRKALSERKMSPSNELVLQLIPLDFIASSTSLVVPSPSEYTRLAMEVYDRCIDFSSSSSSPAIMLEQPLPKSIDFKLTPNPSASLLQENTCLHIAYAQSIDDRWITAAWTDNRGTQQMTASYCLGRKNEPISMPFSDVANEIWKTTLDFISHKKIHWRIMIARVGVMHPSEQEFWTGPAATESEAQVSLTLITVQTDPSLRLLPAPVTLVLNGSNAQSVITPVSTPQASQTSIISPDNASTPTQNNPSAPTAGTPGEPPLEPDTDARLIDFTDQSWGAVLSHRLNNSNSLLELNPALISGYLIKRGGNNIDDAPIVIEVNIVYSEVVGNPRTFHESLLKEVLGYYRGLSTLARVRGVVDGVRDGRPWHVAAVEKAVKALYVLM